MHKILLYYKFIPVPDPESVMFWQRNLCQRLGLMGRIIVSDHGINGTVGGNITSAKGYIREMNTHSRFSGIEYKWSDGRGDEFSKLSVKVRPELVALGADEAFDVFDSGTALRPREWHELLERNPDIVVLDARNHYESEIGRFAGAITPDMSTFRDVKQVLDTLDPSEPVATYCTGDIRCEYLSAYMKHRGFETVYHLDGGIMKYGEEFRDNGLWEGSCYVFDGRRHIEFSPSAAELGTCAGCGIHTREHMWCTTDSCPRLTLMCEACRASFPDPERTQCQRCVSAS